MATTHLIPENIHELYEVHEWRNAAAVMKEACPSEWQELFRALESFRLMKSEIVVGGGRRSQVVERLEAPLHESGWIERKFDTNYVVDGTVISSPTHKIDCFKGRVALEVEWNNKDPFFDRDLNNFRLLFDLRVIDLGVIITRSDNLQRIFDDIGRGPSFGNSTTHMSKLLPRIEGGSGGGCPILVFGISDKLFLDDMV